MIILKERTSIALKKNRLLIPFIKTIIFCAILVFILANIFRILWLWDDSYSVSCMQSFYKLPRNTIDAVYIGSSGVKEFYIAPEGFADNGIAVYPIAASHQSSAAIPYLIEEVHKTQSPRAYLIDVREFITEDLLWDNSIRMTTDALKFSKNRIHLIDKLLEIYAKEQPDKEFSKWDYYFSFSTYHSRWEDLREDDFTGGPTWMGYTIFNHVEAVDNPAPERIISNYPPQPLVGHREQDLADVIAYCKTLGDDADVIFTCTPAVWTDVQLSRLARVEAAVAEAGFAMWDLSLPAVTSQMKLDYSKDMNNPQHVNVVGAIKFTDYLAHVLQELYDLPDHRGDPNYRLWEKEDEEFRNALDSMTEDEDQRAVLVQRGVLK